MKLEITAYDLAQRFIGIHETPGVASNPLVVAMLRLDDDWPQDDSVPWCSAFANYIAWLLRLPRSKSLRARSWLGVGTPVKPEDAAPGFDVVILNRGTGLLDPTVLHGPGHVGFFAGWDLARILILGGNQSNAVNVAAFDATQVLGVRRLLT